MQKNEIQSLSYTTQKITSKQIKDLIIRPEIIKLLGENLGENLLDIDSGNKTLDITSKVQATKAKMNQCDYIKLKSSCTAKETIMIMKRQPMEWDINIVNQIYDKQLTSKLLGTHTTQQKKTKNLLKK